MAYVDGLDDEEQQKNQAATTSGEVVVSGGAGPAGAGGASAQGDGAKSGGKGSGFVNLNQYMDANKGQDARMAGDVVGASAQVKQSVADKSNAYGQKVGSDIKAGTKIADQSVFMDPGKLDRAKFQESWNANYGGPAADKIGADDDSMAIGKALDSLGQQAGNVDTFGGKQQLLKERYAGTGGNRYTTGENIFDTFLVGNEQNKLNEVKDLSKQAQGTWSDNVTNLRGAAGQAKANTDKAREDFRNGYNDLFGRVESGIAGKETELADINKTRDDNYKGVLAQLQGGNGAAVGLSDKVLKRLVADGYDVSKLVRSTGAKALGDVVDGDTRAQYEALQSLGDITGRNGRTFQGLNDTTSNDPEAYAASNDQRDAAISYNAVLEALDKRLGDAQQFKQRTVGKSTQPSSSDKAIADALDIPVAEVLEARSLGLDLNDMLKNIGYGDVAKGTTYQDDLGGLMQRLGITKGVDFSDKVNADGYVASKRPPKVEPAAEEPVGPPNYDHPDDPISEAGKRVGTQIEKQDRKNKSGDYNPQDLVVSGAEQLGDKWYDSREDLTGKFNSGLSNLKKGKIKL